MPEGDKTVTLTPEAVRALDKLRASMGTATLEETLGKVIGTQAAIAEQVGRGNVVRIKDDVNVINVSKS